MRGGLFEHRAPGVNVAAYQALTRQLLYGVRHARWARRSEGASGCADEVPRRVVALVISGPPTSVQPIWEIPVVDERDLPDPEHEAGFITLERVTYRARLEREGELTSEPVRLFYNFIPADAGAKEKPVFVFFNGGPGMPATLLRCFGTATRP